MRHVQPSGKDIKAEAAGLGKVGKWGWGHKVKCALILEEEK